MYFFCNTCYIIFVHPDFRLSREAEKVRYVFHNNSIEQPGYVAFLNRIIEPTLQFLNPEMIGLDYGCGPAPTLSRLLNRKGITCYNYDPLFGFEHPHKHYDFIFATECMEHFFNPLQELQNINSLLNYNGFLSIMTERWSSIEQFEKWYYKNDPTHVCFFHQNTFEYLSDTMKLEILHQDDTRVIIFKKLIIG
jgi:hypothetical protein